MKQEYKKKEGGVIVVRAKNRMSGSVRKGPGIKYSSTNKRGGDRRGLGGPGKRNNRFSSDKNRDVGRDFNRGGFNKSRVSPKSRARGERNLRRGNYIKGRRFNNRRGGRSSQKMPEFNPSQYINKEVKQVKEEVYIPKNTFNSFQINGSLKHNIEKLGMKTPTKIQDQAIPEILKGKDVIGIAETGTGKTSAALVPLVEKTLKSRKDKTLILTPTRELSIQIDKEFKGLTKTMRMFSVVCVGGVNIRPQIKQLNRNHNFIIGTPGRVLDLLKKQHINSDEIVNLVFDEADRMLDMGFMPDIRKIVSKIRKDRQTLFFSATMPEEIKKLTKEFLEDPVNIFVKKEDVSQNIEQDVVFYEHSHKFETLVELLNKKEFDKVIIFGAQKHSVGRLAEHLVSEGISADSIHGNKNSRQRNMALDKFKKKETNVLVATDVVARGIHVDDVSYVINYDLPSTFEDYIHRIGRTGRMNKKGKALTFVDSVHKK